MTATIVTRDIPSLDAIESSRVVVSNGEGNHKTVARLFTWYSKQNKEIKSIISRNYIVDGVSQWKANNDKDSMVLKTIATEDFDASELKAQHNSFIEFLESENVTGWVLSAWTLNG